MALRETNKRIFQVDDELPLGKTPGRGENILFTICPVAYYGKFVSGADGQ